MLAHRAAACCLVGDGETRDGEPYQRIPAAETLSEWRFQRRLWQRVVADGRSGLELVYARGQG